jgi:tRNA threonylcarbamoyladenosine biosynthesis protein TsaE
MSSTHESIQLHVELPEQGATEAFAHGLAMCLAPGDVLLLEGELGAGKTTLLRALAAALGVAPGQVASPTYVLMHRYALPAACAVPKLAGGMLTHVDAYRIRSADDLDVIGWDMVMEQGAGNGRAKGRSVLCVEWASRIASSLPPAGHACVLTLSHAGEGSRSLHASLPASWHAREAVADLRDKPPTRCRVTGKWVSPLAKAWPFANEQARGADLFGWLSGSYRISREVREDDDASDVRE